MDLLQLGVRLYDSETGRFTQRDPLRDGLNCHVYAESRPTLYKDPTGLQVAPGPGLRMFAECCDLFHRVTSFRTAMELCCEKNPMPLRIGGRESRMSGAEEGEQCAVCWEPPDDTSKSFNDRFRPGTGGKVMCVYTRLPVPWYESWWGGGPTTGWQCGSCDDYKNRGLPPW